MNLDLTFVIRELLTDGQDEVALADQIRNKRVLIVTHLYATIESLKEI